jgi:xanthine dehydrogenase accessory factor
MFMTNLADIYAAIHESLQRGESICVATVIGADGSTPRSVGAKMLMWNNGRTLGSVGGGQLELKVLETAEQVFKSGQPVRLHFSLKTRDDPGICGGEAEVFVELVTSEPRLVIIGGGHVGRALGQVASLLDFRVVVMDSRELDGAFFPETVEMVRLESYSNLPPEYFDAQTCVAIMTPEHAGDREALAGLLDIPLKYLGMIGSQRKVQLTFQHFRERGVPEEHLDRVHAPIGLDIGSETPMEIAVSILAEIIQVRSTPRSRKSATTRRKTSCE